MPILQPSPPPYGSFIARGGGPLTPRIYPSCAEVTYLDGSIAEGEFKDGKLHGSGKKTDQDGSIAEGEFVRDGLQGQGKRTLSDGTVEEGEFKGGFLN